MFYSYIVHDVVEIEPVYLPKPSVAAVTLASSRCGDDEKASMSATTGARVHHSTAPPLIKAEGGGGEEGEAAAKGRRGHPRRPGPRGTAAAPAPAAAAPSLVKSLFGSLEQLRAFLAQQEHARHHVSSARRADAAGGIVGGDEGAEAGPQLEDDVYRASITDALLHRLTEKYVGRVLPRCGLCVAIRDVLELSPAEIRGPSASAWVGVVCEVCVLAPRPGTRLWARVLAHHRSGLDLSLIDLLSGTMRVCVPGTELLPGSCYDAERAMWYLPFEAAANAAGGGHHRNYYLVGEPVLFKVLETVVRDEHSVQEAAERKQQQLCTAPLNAEDGGGSGKATAAAGKTWQASPDNEDAVEDGEALMEVHGSFAGDGLGPVSWFAEGEGEEEES